MDELEVIRAQLLGIRTQADSAIRSITALMAQLRKAEPAVPEKKPRYLGDDDAE